jgi:hypothetical protein
VLLVSGSNGKLGKREINSLTCLQHLQLNKFDLNGIELGVAFNPYFKDKKDQEIERKRISDKIETKYVSHIWLQYGTDIQLLKESIEFLNSLESIKSKKVRLIGSLFIPSKVLLARMKFRPWNGVFLSDAYLNDLEEAVKITKEIVNVYLDFDWSLVKNIFLEPYFMLYGEVYAADIDRNYELCFFI